MKAINALNAGWLIKAMGMVEPLAKKVFSFMPYTPLFNVTGQPSMSVPLHWTPNGLPVGMHFIAGLGEDAILFRLAAQLEQVQPWSHKAPAVL
jgi:amidase